MTSVSVPERAAVPAGLRRPAALLALLAAVVLATLGVRNAGRSHSSYADRLLQAFVEDWIPQRGRGFRLIESLGDPRSAFVLAVLLAGLALLAGRRRLALLALAGPGLTGVATTVLKPLFDRTLDGNLAYPSGHTAAFTSLAIVAALLLVNVLRAGPTATVLVVAVAAVGAGSAMAVALTSLDVHYPTDTIGGFCTAVAVVLGCALALDRLAAGRAARRGP